MFFVDDRVYKLKKPIVTGFVDFSSEEARRRACEREVELNRRLAPDVYLGLATVLGPDGATCEHLVVMRRLPGDRRLSSRVTNGEDVRGDLNQIAAALARFHSQAATSEEISRSGEAGAVLGRWRANTDEMLALAPEVLDRRAVGRLDVLAARYIAGRHALFAARAASGKVRDGHGDLLADDIFCLDDGPRIIDCLEFDDRLRYADVMEDVAFLAMDLERLGSPQLAEAFLSAYQRAAADTPPPTLQHLYIAYRAQVRAKVAAIRAGQGLGGAEEASRLLDQATEHLQAAQVRMVLVGGAPGVGKSVLSAALGQRLGWTVLRSDALRQEVIGPPVPAGYGEGRYQPAAIEAVYAELLHRSRAALAMGEPVILDASWRRQAHRDAAGRIAAETSSDLVELRCVAPSELVARRLDQRSASGRDLSEATPQVARQIAAGTDPWPAAIDVDTTGTPESGLEHVLKILGLQRAGRP
ncbi:MAG TPA: AAA family ATPase [Actinomycetota bacterium]|nr:AAA family ATPase [Actinomycetota bacterium]